MSSDANTSFPPDHPIALLRNMRHPRPSQVRRSMRQRVAWLEGKISARLNQPDYDVKTDPLYDELRSLAVLLDAYNEE